MKIKNKITILIVIIDAFEISLGQTYDEMDSLLGRQFNSSRYNKYLRPLKNQSHVIQVNITHYVKSIEYLEISTGEFLITGYFEIKWTDEMLTWDPDLYGGKKRMQLPKEKYWKPQLYLTNGPANKESSIYGSGFYPAWVTYQGRVKIAPAGSYKTKCNIDTTFYPYDMHTCVFQFVNSNHDGSELKLNSPSTDMDFSDIKENGEWEIKNIDTDVLLVIHENIENITIPMFQSSFSLKRRAKFEFINSLTPIMFMYFLNIAACFIHPDSGERITFAITLYLSLVFSSTAVIERVPNNSLKMPILSYQMLTINVINTVGVLWSIFIVNCARKSVIQNLPNCLLRMIQRKRQKNEDNFDVNRVNKPKVSLSSVEHTHSNNITDDKDVCINKQTANITGKEMAEVLDKIYFWIIIICLFIFNVIFSAVLYKSWFN